jgi:hypothetical protein
VYNKQPGPRERERGREREREKKHIVTVSTYKVCGSNGRYIAGLGPPGMGLRELTWLNIRV